MPSSPNPFTNPQVWDKFLVGTVENPGIAKITGFKRPNEWDVKKGKGTIGATLTFVQKPPAKGQAIIQIFSADQYDAWVNDFAPLLKYDPTKKTVTAIDIYHPAIAQIDVHSVVCENLGQPEFVSVGLYTVTVDLIEYFPAPKASAVSTAGSSTPLAPNTTPGTPPDPVADAQQQQIAALLQQARSP